MRLPPAEVHALGTPFRTCASWVTPVAFVEVVEKGLAATGSHREEVGLKGPPQRSLTVYVSRFRGHGAPGAVIVRRPCEGTTNQR